MTAPARLPDVASLEAVLAGLDPASADAFAAFDKNFRHRECQHERALELIARSLDRVPDATRLLEARARIQAARRDRVGLDETLELMRGRASARASALAQAFLFAAGMYEAMGESGAALHALEEANRVEPMPERLRSVAHAAERLGDLTRALRAC